MDGRRMEGNTRRASQGCNRWKHRRALGICNRFCAPRYWKHGATGDEIMNEEWEDAQDEWISSLYSDFAQDVLAGRDDLYGEVINQFTSERLQSYYLENPHVLDRALWALTEARSLLTTYPSAALILAVAAAEVGLKSGLLKPILHGLVHDDAMAVVIAELVPERRDSQFKKLLFMILKEYGGVDLQTFKRSSSTVTLWAEIEATQKIRNRVVHCAEQATGSDAQNALAIASVINESLFPAVISALGLQVDASFGVSTKKR
jgi:hypothetical protein